MQTRNRIAKQSVARIYSVKAFALVLALSLSALVAPPASALEACATSATDPNCSISTAGSYQVVVNKVRPLTPVTYQAKDLIRVPKFNPYGRVVRKAVSKAIVLMGTAMKADGKGTLIVQSGYRSYKSQKTIHNAKVRLLGKIKGENLAARPGYSEHQTGLAVDFAAKGVSTLKVSFAKTKAGIWLAENAYRFGFVLRYPKGETPTTGYSFEPWHFRYVGLDLAKVMHDQNIPTLEAYFSLPAAPNYLN
jgi:D-alanyl-D-alanine carboxypeptidase